MITLQAAARVALTTAALTVAGCAHQPAPPQPAPAPEPTASGELRRLEVTGNRIKRADIESSQPVFVIQGQQATPGTSRQRLAIEPRDYTDPRRLAAPGRQPAPPEATAVRRLELLSADLAADYRTWIETLDQSISTFSADVDRASWNRSRAMLQAGTFPDRDSIRLEEFVNAMTYDYTPPEHEDFQLFAEAFPADQGADRYVLHLGVQGREVIAADRPSAHLVFVIDVSGSMEAPGRIDRVKRSLLTLTDALRDDDLVSLVAYGDEASVILPPTSGADRFAIQVAIERLVTGGGTNAAEGVRLGYQLAREQFDPNRINRLILCSDGVANIGATTATGIVTEIGEAARRGIHMSTVGFGMGVYNDTLMERLAVEGQGQYHYIDSEQEAQRVFVENLTGTLQVIAEDLKLQVDFDPAVVTRYRQLGYVNRQLATEDFDDDTVDAAEIGAGHAVTALYEIELATTGWELGTFRIRYKVPGEDASLLIESPVPGTILRPSLAATSPSTRLSWAAAQTARALRAPEPQRSRTLDAVSEILVGLPPLARESESAVQLQELIDHAVGLALVADGSSP
ncbi:MAG: von Willebrand factor type A domain-containing protein [Pseudomonadota bacterium]